MRTSTLLRLFSLLGGAALMLAGGGCDVSVLTFGGDDCTVDGVTYADGASFAAPDGCNSCTCDDGEAQCTLLGCITTCQHDGDTYAVGESFPAGDGCNLCMCEPSGNVACTDVACGGCVYDGTTYGVGQSFPATDGCNTCTCEEGGWVACSEKECTGPLCTYEGQIYEPGESFDAIDGCNTCTCMGDGEVACTEKACACDPEEEWWRSYVSTSAEECQLIDYTCPGNTAGFQNECGCGCEQSESCPQWFDCMPPSPCDLETIAEECPYSKIAY